MASVGVGVEYENNRIFPIITRYPGKPFTSTLFPILKNMPYLIGLIRSPLPESLTISRASGGVVGPQPQPGPRFVLLDITQFTMKIMKK